MTEWVFEIWITVGCIGCGYALGSLPFGLLLTKYILRIDIRHIGSGNIGATNVLRTGHKGLGACTLGLDMLKGFLAVGVSWWLCTRTGTKPIPESMRHILVLGGALSAVIGHVFPVWLRFRGGKGVATYFGTLMALDLWVGCTTLALWVGTVRATHISSLGAIVGVVCAPFMVFFMTHRLDLVLYTLISGGLVLGMHHQNIRRILNHTEPRVGENTLSSKLPSDAEDASL